MTWALPSAQSMTPHLRVASLSSRHILAGTRVHLAHLTTAARPTWSLCTPLRTLASRGFPSENGYGHGNQSFQSSPYSQVSVSASASVSVYASAFVHAFVAIVWRTFPNLDTDFHYHDRRLSLSSLSLRFLRSLTLLTQLTQMSLLRSLRK